MNNIIFILFLISVVFFSSCQDHGEWKKKHYGEKIIYKDITLGGTKLIHFRQNDGGMDLQEKVSDEDYKKYNDGDIIVCDNK